MMYKKLFIRFLKQNHVYEKFMARYLIDKRVFRPFAYFIEHTSPRNFVLYAFTWNDEMWLQIHYRWETVVLEVSMNK